MDKRGAGSIRERRPGVFEIQVAVSVDPRSGRTIQRSFYFHGSREDASARREEASSLRGAPRHKAGVAVPDGWRTVGAVGRGATRLAARDASIGIVDGEGPLRRLDREAAADPSTHESIKAPRPVRSEDDISRSAPISVRSSRLG